MIKSLKVTGLNRCMSFDLTFHEDINIVTGRNGSGKTTVLKLLWYAISGNLKLLISEVPFQSLDLVTDRIRLAMTCERRSSRRFIKITYRIDPEEERTIERSMDQIMGWGELGELNRRLALASRPSIFLPTFRRIEGGFSITPPETEGSYLGARPGGVREAMNDLSERMSARDHRLVVSISTEDIDRLLAVKYAEISESTNRRHSELSEYILQRVGNRAGSDSGPGPAEARAIQALGEIERRTQLVKEESEDLLRPFTVLSGLVSKVFQYKGIKLSGPVTLGEAREAIGSDRLSAGEKQMLSFLCYNAFANQACIFIDEPEISLHVDWQRLLFPILLKQSTGNQFIVATHSPFIYSKYSDKELVLEPNRGDEDADAATDGEGDHRLPRENELADVAR